MIFDLFLQRKPATIGCRLFEFALFDVSSMHKKRSSNFDHIHIICGKNAANYAHNVKIATRFQPLRLIPDYHAESEAEIRVLQAVSGEV